MEKVVELGAIIWEGEGGLMTYCNSKISKGAFP